MAFYRISPLRVTVEGQWRSCVSAFVLASDRADGHPKRKEKSVIAIMKRFLTIGVLLQTITGLMTLILVTVFAIYAVNALQAQQEARRVSALIDISDDLFTATLNVRLERGTVNGLLVTPEPIDLNAQGELTAERARSGKAIDSSLAKFTGVGLRESDRTELRDLWNAWIEMRHEVDQALQEPIGQRPSNLHQKWIGTNAKVVGAINHVSRQLEAELSTSDSFLAEMIKIKQIAWTVRANSGDDRLLTRDAMLRGTKLSLDQQRQFAVLADRIDAMWQLVLDDAQLVTMPSSLKEAIETANRLYFMKFRPIRNALIDNLSAGRQVDISPPEWLKLVLPAQQSMYQVAKTAFDLAGAQPCAGLPTEISSARFPLKVALTRLAFSPARFVSSATTPLKRANCGLPRKALKRLTMPSRNSWQI